MSESPILRVIEDNSVIERIATPIHDGVESLLEKAPPLRTILDGTWLGHPLHPAITDIPVGSWTAGIVLDLMELAGNRKMRRAADVVTGVGLAGALLSAVTGLADWSYTRRSEKRTGFVHASLNTLAATLYTTSLVLRRKNKRTAAIALSATGYGIVLFSAWLGGALSYHYGVGVNHRAFENSGPRDWVPVADEGSLTEGSLRRVEADGVPVLLARVGGEIRAIGDTCTHMGCSLAEGHLEGDRVVCRCHGSQFRLRDGRAMVGPASVSEPRFDVRVMGGRIEVRRAPEEDSDAKMRLKVLSDQV